jgi:hypothetical protein
MKTVWELSFFQEWRTVLDATVVFEAGSEEVREVLRGAMKRIEAARDSLRNAASVAPEEDEEV